MPIPTHRFRKTLVPLACVLVLGATALSVSAADMQTQREHYRSALDAIAHEPGDAWKRYLGDLGSYPLLPYLERAALERRKGQPTLEQVQAFNTRWPDTLVATELTETLLRALAKAENWSDFRALWKGSEDADLRCAFQRARIANGESPDYAKDIAGLWQVPRPTPESCEPLFAWARQNGQLTDAVIWQRIEAAAAAANSGTASRAAALLDEPQRAQAERIAASVLDPGPSLDKSITWPDNARNRDAISYAMMRHARRSTASAVTAWARLGDRFKWDEAQKNRVLNALAVYRAASYEADGMARLKALPEGAKDASSREWHVRLALASQDWPEALAALEDMDAEQSADARWRYMRARVLTKLDREAEATAVFAEVAREANFHGFLAADWINAPYSICPTSLDVEASAQKAVDEQADLARAFELHALGNLQRARREWNFAMAKLPVAQQRLAANAAYVRGWLDRAVFLLSASKDSLTYYEQRFPLGEKSEVLRSSRQAGIDPAWSYAIIRAESAWMTDARSHADAYGLMQLLPAVARKVARDAKLPYERPSDLFVAQYNIKLGTRFLGQMADQYSGSPWLASAAYNAGGAPVKRWLEARGSLEPDFFIETIPYKETRDYVARVLAFSVIYDWLMNDKALPLSSRMPKVGQAYQSPKDDSPRKAVLCAVTPAPVATIPAAQP